MDNTQEFVFMWKIHNFSCNIYKPGEAIDSPLFEAINFGGSQWSLRLYPQGEDEECNQHGLFGVYLYKKKNDIYSEESSVAFELKFIGDENKTLVIVKKDVHVYKLNECFGWKNYSLTKIVSHGLKKWPGNVLTIQCHLFGAYRQKYKPDLEVRSEIPLRRISFLWNIKIADISSKPVRKDLLFTRKSLYEIALSMPDNVAKIYVQLKEDASFPDTSLPEIIECKLSLVKSNGDVLKSKSFTHLFEANDESKLWELPSFITKAELDSNRNCWKNDNFLMLWEMVASEGINPVITSPVNGATQTANTSTILQDLKIMLCNHIHSDIKLKVGNEEIHAHKAILASRSPVFSAMFAQNMIESQTGVINIPDFEVNIMKHFLEFLYTDTVEHLDCETAKKLLLAGDKYQVPRLVEKCAAFLESDLSLENAIEILTIADMVGYEGLKKAALNFISRNSVLIFASLEWEGLLEGNVRLACDIISNSLSFVPKN